METGQALEAQCETLEEQYQYVKGTVEAIPVHLSGYIPQDRIQIVKDNKRIAEETLDFAIRKGMLTGNPVAFGFTIAQAQALTDYSMAKAAKREIME